MAGLEEDELDGPELGEGLDNLGLLEEGGAATLDRKQNLVLPTRSHSRTHLGCPWQTIRSVLVNSRGNGFVPILV